MHAQPNVPPNLRRRAPARTGRRRAFLASAITVLMIGTIVISGPAPAAQAADASPADRAVRVMTFNIHHAQGTDEALDLHRIAAVIQARRPAVVGLQEVDRHWSARSDFADQAARLAELLRMHVVFGANLDLDPPAPGLPRRQYGTAILSRYPILSWENTLLPRFGDHEQRGLLHAEVMLRGVRLHVYNTHLQHNDAAERLAQARAILDVIGPAAPAVLTGDLNAPPDTPEIRALTDRLRDTWTGDGGYTHPSEAPDQRIDYVLTSPATRVRDTAVVTDTPAASDHLPVVSDLVVRGPATG